MRRRKAEENVPEKANRILNAVLIILFLILIRVWHLAVFQHDEKVEASKRPQRRVVIERAERATICDRFGEPLALNKVQYNAALAYSDLREIPRTEWVVNEMGEKVKVAKRKEYIASLAALLGQELDLDAERLEDLIHSKASLFGHVPFVVKENISEREYFRLQMLQKDWPGIRADVVGKRTYPRGEMGGEVVGYMGAISKGEYEAITREMQQLRTFLALRCQEEEVALPEGYERPEDVEKRLGELEAKAYAINDYIGKAGIEGAFDEKLRGCRGKKTFLMDAHGHILEEINAQEPRPGHRLYLTISSELQAYCEELITTFEQAKPSERRQAVLRRAQLPEKQPWIKGGAIIALDPNTGEVLALASYPRFDPQDFSRPKEEAGKKVSRWLESETYIASMWDRKTPLIRERINTSTGRYYDQEEWVSWENYLEFILPKNSPIRRFFEAHGTLASALTLQHLVDELLSLFPGLTPPKVIDLVYSGDEEVACGVMLTLPDRQFFQAHMAVVGTRVEEIKAKLTPYFSSLPLNYEKLLLVDLCRVAVDARTFTPALQEILGGETLSEYRETGVNLLAVEEGLRDIVRALFHENDFRVWREEEFKAHLAAIRKEESKNKKKASKPYLEILDETEKARFQAFWEKNRSEFIAFFLGGTLGSSFLAQKSLHPYLVALKEWQKELKSDEVSMLSWGSHYIALQNEVKRLSPHVLRPYLATFRSFEKLNRPLLGLYRGLRGPLEKHLAAAFYPQHGYGFARSHAFRQATTIGSLFKLIPAYEALRQRYVEHIDERDLNPLVFIDDKHRTGNAKNGGWNVGFTAEGKPIPLFYHGGRLPRTDHAGVGKVDLVRALETSSNPYFALLAGDILEDPEDLCKAAALFGFGEKTEIDLPGEFAGNLPSDVAYNKTGLYSMAIGQHTLVGTPLQAAVMLSAFANGGNVLKPKIVGYEIADGNLAAIPTEVRRCLFLPESIRSLLLSGMRQVVWGDKGTARSLKTQFPHELLRTIVGKTSTAEEIVRLGLDCAIKWKDVWFGAIAFDPKGLSEFDRPELVVVVYLRLAEYGHEAAPLAVKVIQKWHEIKKKRSQ